MLDILKVGGRLYKIIQAYRLYMGTQNFILMSNLYYCIFVSLALLRHVYDPTFSYV